MKRFLFSAVLTGLLVQLLGGCGSNNRLRIDNGQSSTLPPKTVALSCVARALNTQITIASEGQSAPAQFEVIAYRNGVPIQAVVVDSDFPSIATPISGGNANSPAFELSTAGTFAFRFHVQDPSNPTETGSCEASVQASQSTEVPNVSLSIGSSTTSHVLPNGGSAVIGWSSQDATACKLFFDQAEVRDLPSQGVLNSPVHTNTTQSPVDHVYTVRCSGPGGTDTASVILTVNPPPKPNLVVGGQNTILLTDSATPFNIAWSSEFASSCAIAANGQPMGQTGLTGAGAHPGVSADTSFVLACSDGVTVVTDTVNVTLNAPSVSLSLSASASVAPGKSITVSWTSKNVASCVIKLGDTATPHTNPQGSFVHIAQEDVKISALCTGTQNRTAQDEKTLDVQCTQTAFTLETTRNSSKTRTIECDGTIGVSTADDDVGVTIQRGQTHYVLYLCNELDSDLKNLGFPSSAQSCHPLRDQSMGFACNPDTGASLGTDDDNGDCRNLAKLKIPIKRGDILKIWRGEDSGDFGIRVNYEDSSAN